MANTIPGSGPITAYAEVIGWLLTKELSDDPQLKHTGTRTLGRFRGSILFDALGARAPDLILGCLSI